MLHNLLFFFPLFVFFTLLTIRAGLFKSVRNSDKSLFANQLVFLFILFTALFVAYRPLDVSDAMPYFIRYTTAPNNTTFSDIVNADSFYRGTDYSMSKLVNSLFYLSYKIGLSYRVFVFLVSLVVIEICFFYSKKVLNVYSVEYNDYLLLSMILIFFSFRYQFVAFAQGVAMCIGLPILYYLIRKKYFKLFLCCLLAVSIHISGVYYIVLVLIHIFSKKNKYLCIFFWGIIGVLLFSKYGVLVNNKILYLVNRGINYVATGNPIYGNYLKQEETISLAVTNLLYWGLCGILILVRIDYAEYWKIISILVISLLANILFSSWAVVHRFTDCAKVYMPLAIILYVYKAKPTVVFIKGKDKAIVVFSVFWLGFAHSLSLLGFV